MKPSKRSFRALAVLFVALVVLAGGQMAWAHQSPAGCTQNAFEVELFKDKTSIANGETVTFTVTVENDAASACDVTGTNIAFHCPAGDGTPTGAAIDWANGFDFLVPLSPINLYVVPCIVNFNAGVTSAQALVDAVGILHANPDYDLVYEIVRRTLSVVLERCGDGAINQSCETCDTNAFPANAPASHGACRTGGDCGVNSCTFCGDGIVNGSEFCDDGNDIDNRRLPEQLLPA
jgi:hypothetical protein